MTEQEKAFREAVEAARVERVLALKTARSALAYKIQASQGEAIEAARRTYDAKVAEIWADYDASIDRARNLLNQGSGHAAFVQQPSGDAAKPAIYGSRRLQ